jgi:hypothetical protein
MTHNRPDISRESETSRPGERRTLGFSEVVRTLEDALWFGTPAPGGMLRFVTMDHAKEATLAAAVLAIPIGE